MYFVCFWKYLRHELEEVAEKTKRTVGATITDSDSASWSMPIVWQNSQGTGRGVDTLEILSDWAQPRKTYSSATAKVAMSTFEDEEAEPASATMKLRRCRCLVCVRRNSCAFRLF